MKKYLGIVKIYDECMGGLDIVIKSKTYDDESLLEKWFDLYPNSKHIKLLNTEELDSMFKIFEDTTSITEEEKNF